MRLAAAAIRRYHAAVRKELAAVVFEAQAIVDAMRAAPGELRKQSAAVDGFADVFAEDVYLARQVGGFDLQRELLIQPTESAFGCEAADGLVARIEEARGLAPVVHDVGRHTGARVRFETPRGGEIAVLVRVEVAISGL